VNSSHQQDITTTTTHTYLHNHHLHYHHHHYNHSHCHCVCQLSCRWCCARHLQNRQERPQSSAVRWSYVLRDSELESSLLLSPLSSTPLLLSPETFTLQTRPSATQWLTIVHLTPQHRHHRLLGLGSLRRQSIHYAITTPAAFCGQAALAVTCV
jgi:hypothetical protein